MNCLIKRAVLEKLVRVARLQSAHVRTALRDVTHPSIRRVSGVVIDDSQVAHLHVGNVEHGDFKVHVDGADFSSDLGGAGLGECNLGFHGLFGSARYFLDGPENLAIGADEFGIGGAASGTGNDRTRCRGRALWNGDFHRDVCAKVVRGHVGTDQYRDFQLFGIDFLDGGNDSKGCSKISGNSVVQENKLSIGRDERQYPRILKLVEVHNLVEVDVVHRWRAILPVALSDGQILVKRQSKLGAARQVGFHLNASIDGAVEDVSIRREQDIQSF
mmetsp:Transcript_16421/g.41174  ORF Transcript_16421/g.41174 Transcript_16421/m.41174 type:complete len:273 (-) Transcript_16421:726-1544(-)